MSTKIREIDEQIEDLQTKISILNNEKENLKELSEDQRLAIDLHDTLCHWNHTDGCGWFYEIKDGFHQWDGASHSPYLEKAQKVIKYAAEKDITAIDLIAVCEIFKEI